MLLFVVVLLKRTSYNKETKREAENERRENERNQYRSKKAITADSAPDPESLQRTNPGFRLNQGWPTCGACAKSGALEGSW